MLGLSRRNVVFTKDSKQAHSIGKTLHRFENMVKQNNWRLLVLEYSSYPVSFSILLLSLSLGPYSITVAVLDLSRRHRERQRREFTLFCETRHSSVPRSLEKPTVQCTATNLNCIGEKKVEMTLPKCPRVRAGWHGHSLWSWHRVLSHHPRQACLMFWHRGQEEGAEKGASFPSALPLCRLAVVEARLGHSWSVQSWAAQCTLRPALHLLC